MVLERKSHSTKLGVSSFSTLEVLEQSAFILSDKFGDLLASDKQSKANISFVRNSWALRVKALEDNSDSEEVDLTSPGSEPACSDITSYFVRPARGVEAHGVPAMPNN